MNYSMPSDLVSLMSGDWKKEKVRYLKDDPHIVIWWRDQCRCVYCDFDLLQSYDFAYYYYDYDHILPQSKYPELENERWNVVLSCLACNRAKGSFDPNCDPIPGGGQKPVTIYTPDHRILEQSERFELIKRARAYLEWQRDTKMKRFAEDKELILRALRELTTAADASAEERGKRASAAGTA